MNVTELKPLLDLLKTEGVLHFVWKDMDITFHPAALPCALDLVEVTADDEPQEAPEVKPEIPERLRGLNPNYFHPALKLDSSDL